MIRQTPLAAFILNILLFLVIPISPLRAERFVNIGAPVNSPVDDVYPSVTADGKTMVFNSRRNGQKYMDLYITHFVNGRWSEPQPITELNSPYSDETPFITPNGDMILFSSDRDGSNELPRDFTTGSIRISFDLYRSRRVGDHWTAPEKIPGDVNTTEHERFPALSADRKTLYYSTWPFGDITRSRIMKAVLKNGRYMVAEELPASINSGNQEVEFLPAEDQGGFYFTSRREGGFGGWDIYFIPWSAKEGFGEPVNAGGDINTTGDEIAITRAGSNFFMSARREPNRHDFDIYMTRVVRERTVHFRTIDRKTGKPVPAQIQIKPRTRSELNQPASFESKTDNRGDVRIKLEGSVERLEISVEEKGYLPLMEEIPLENDEGLPIVLQLSPLEKDASFDIHAIQFDYNSATIRDESFSVLDSLVAYLKKNEKVRVEIIGHTDMKGSQSFNMKLSLRRAKSVRDYLVKKGLPASRFQVRGAGKSHPVVEGVGPGFDEKNRRTEFKILED